VHLLPYYLSKKQEKMLGKLKKGVMDAKATAEIEADYQMSKRKNNFEHPPEVGSRIKAYQDMYDSCDEISHRVNSWVEKYQDLVNAEIKMVERINDLAANQLGNTATTFKQFVGGETQFYQARQKHLTSVVEAIQSPLKKWLSEQQPIKTKIDQTNKSLTELKYWKKKGGSNVSAEQDAQVGYDSNKEQLLVALQSVPQDEAGKYVTAFASLQYEFLETGRNVAPKLNE